MASHQANGVDALTQRLGTSSSPPPRHLTKLPSEQFANSVPDGVSVKDSIHAPTSNGLSQKAAYIPPHMREKIQQGSGASSYSAKYPPSHPKDMSLTISNGTAPRTANGGWGNPEARPFQPRAAAAPSGWDSAAPRRTEDWSTPRAM